MVEYFPIGFLFCVEIYSFRYLPLARHIWRHTKLIEIWHFFVCFVHRRYTSNHRIHIQPQSQKSIELHAVGTN